MSLGIFDAIEAKSNSLGVELCDSSPIKSPPIRAESEIFFFKKHHRKSSAEGEKSITGNETLPSSQETKPAVTEQLARRHENKAPLQEILCFC